MNSDREDMLRKHRLFSATAGNAADGLGWGKSKEFICPSCKGKAVVRRSDYNGHLTAICKNCDFFIME